MTWALLSTGKSGKREVAVSLLLLWAFASAYVFFWIPSEKVKDYTEVWSTLTWACLLWAAGAFGIDFAMKSGVFGAPKPAAQPSARRRQDSPENYTGAV